MSVKIRENETHRFCDFCGKWITHKNWFSHRSTRTHMDQESKNVGHPLIDYFEMEEEVTKINNQIKSSNPYDYLTYQETIEYELIQKEVTKNNFVIIKNFDNVKTNDSFVFNEKDTHKPTYFNFINGHFQRYDDNSHLFMYMFDMKYKKVLIFKASKTNAVESLVDLTNKIDVKEYVTKVFKNDDEYTDEDRLKIFSKNMINLREKISPTITINDLLKLDFFKDYDYEKYEITSEGFKKIKILNLS